MKYIVMVMALMLTAPAYSADLTQWHWPQRTFHISTGDLSSTSVGPSDWEAAFANAVSRWNSAGVPFTLTTDTNTQLESCDFNDPNTAYFSADACGEDWPQNVVGLSVTWSQTHSGEAIQTSILFNASESWGVYDGPPTATVEFTRVAVHELGHSIGIGHTTTSGAIMEPVGSSTIAPQNDDLAGVHSIYNIDDVVVLDDFNGDGAQELVPIRRFLPSLKGRVHVRESNDGALLRTFSYFSGYTPTTTFVASDRNGNGVPDLAAVQRRNSDGRTLVEVRDPSTGANVGNIWFSPGHTPREAIAIPDISGNGVEEFVVLHTRDSDGAVAAQIRDSNAGAFVRNVYFSPGFHPVDMALVPDVNGNNAPELALAMIQQGSSRGIVQIRDLGTGSVISSIWMPTGYALYNVAVINDSNGNGAPDIAALVKRIDDPSTNSGPIAVRIGDTSSGNAVRTIFYRPAGSSVFGRHPLAVLPDFSGNGMDEIAIAVQVDSTQRTVLATHDSGTGAQLSSIFVTPDFDAERLVVVNSLNGNNSSEVGVYGFSASFQPQVIMYDPAISSRLNTVYFPFLISP